MFSAIFVFSVSTLSGCGGGGGEAVFDESDTQAQTQEELDEAADYEKMLAEQEKENY